MMKVTNKWSVRLVNGHGLGWFDTFQDAQTFANEIPMDTQINKVTVHEMVSVA